MPVMVCVDGFILTHAVERVDIPEQAQVDAYLPPYEPVQVLDPKDPISIGAMVGPEAFTEVRYLQHYKQTLALRLIPQFAAEFKSQFGRDSGGLLRSYRAEDAELIVVAMGSVNGTIKDTIDEMRADGVPIGLVTLVSFRPFPTAALREKLVRARNVVVIEKSLAVGMGGPLANNVDLALRNVAGAPQVHSVIAGLGGRPITCTAPASRAAPRLRAAVGRLAFPRSQRRNRRQGTALRPQGAPLRPDRGKPAAPPQRRRGKSRR